MESYANAGLDAANKIGKMKIIWNLVTVTLFCLCMMSVAICLMSSTNKWEGAPKVKALVTSDPICNTRKVGKSMKTTCDMEISYTVNKLIYKNKLRTNTRKFKGNLIEIQYMTTDPNLIQQTQTSPRLFGSSSSSCVLCIFLITFTYSYYAYNSVAMSTATGISATSKMIYG